MATFEQIQEANKTIHTTNIKGKEYAEVNQRIKAFRMLYPEGAIHTDLLSNDGGICVMRAVVSGENGQVLGTGHAYEKESASYINKTSYIENCETSAVGRALGMAGFGIDTSVASYEEVKTAIEQQEAKEPALATDLEKKTFVDLCKLHGVDYKQIAKQAGVTLGEQMTKEQHGKALLILKEIEELKK